MSFRTLRAALVAAALGLPLAAPAQTDFYTITAPRQSQHALVSQRLGITDVTVEYHRPLVKGRKIWGDVVPWGQVWRSGANENTVIAFSDPVTVEGQALPAGRYGLHMLPTETAFTIIFSKNSTSWGSFSYDEKEDVVRFSATPKPADFEERLEYRFENPTDNSVDVVMQWEKLAVSFPIQVDTNAVVMESLKKQLRGLPRFGWQAWNQAAQWALQHDTDLPQALQWADQSVKKQTTFANLRTKAAILEKQGDTKQAEDLRAQAMKIATEQDINNYGYALLGQKKYDEAIAIFRKNLKDYPNSWNCYDSLGEALAAKGDTKASVENYRKALSMTTDPVQKKRIEDILAKMKA